jgi:uncharacterized protein YbjT (DUF2867 family)
LVRNAARRPEAERLRAAGIDLVDGDLRAADSLAAACAGVNTVVCTVTTMPHGSDDGLRRVDRDGVLALIGAAARAGVARFVYLSYSGGIEQPSPLHDAKRGAELALQESAMEAVILRPSFFMQAWLGGHALDRERGVLRIWGAGTAPVSFVSAVDVARLAAAAVMREDQGSRTLEIGGPEATAPLEAARIIGDALGRELEIEHVPEAALAAMQASSDPLQSTFGALGLAYAHGDAIPDARETAAAYGVQLTSIPQYAATLSR